jgi:hypothetical protein
MCGCLFAIVAALSPRFAFVLLWVFSDLVDRAYDTFFIPMLGVLFLPFTSLMYVLAFNPVLDGLSGWGWFFVFIGLLLDIGSYAGSGYTNKETIVEYAGPVGEA